MTGPTAAQHATTATDQATEPTPLPSPTPPSPIEASDDDFTTPTDSCSGTVVTEIYTPSRDGTGTFVVTDCPADRTPTAPPPTEFTTAYPGTRLGGGYVYALAFYGVVAGAVLVVAAFAFQWARRSKCS